MFTDEQLKKLKSLETGQNTSNKRNFDQLRCIYLDAPKRPHYPKLADGTRSKDSDGFSFTFSEIGTSRRVTVVSSNMDLELTGIYIISGLGYEFRNSQSVFIDENGKIQKLKL